MMLNYYTNLKHIHIGNIACAIPHAHQYFTDYKVYYYIRARSQKISKKNLSAE